MNDTDFLPGGSAVLGVVDEIMVILVARRNITLVVVSQQNEIALVGDLAELEFFIELDRVEMILLAEEVDKLVLGSLAGGIENDLTDYVVAAALVLERADLPFEDRIIGIEGIFDLEEVNSLARFVDVGVGGSA